MRYSGIIRKGQWQADRVIYLQCEEMVSCCSWKNKGLSRASLQQRDGVRLAVRNLQCECWVPRGPGTRQGEDPAACSWTEVPRMQMDQARSYLEARDQKMTHVGLNRPRDAEITSDSPRSRSEP